jgi:hypothetical protein
MRWSIFVRRLTEMARWRAPTDDEVHAALRYARMLWIVEPMTPAAYSPA